MRSQLNTLEAVRHRKKPLVTVAHFCAGGGGGTYASWSGSMAVQGSFSQYQNDTTSWNYSTDDTYTPPSPTDGTGGGWQSSGSGSTVDSGSSSFSYSGSGSYGCGFSATPESMQQNGGANESFCYTKDYTDGASGWQVQPTSDGWAAGDAGTGGGASGSGSTYSSYTGEPLCWVGWDDVTAPDCQSGSNNTSYTFNTTAAYNGIDWSETGQKSSSGSGSASDSFSPSADGQSFTASNNSSYNYTEQAFLDPSGTWQPLFSASGGAGGGSGCGSGNVCASDYVENTNGFEGSSTGSVSQYYSGDFSYMPDGQWQVASEGNGVSVSGAPPSGYSLPALPPTSGSTASLVAWAGAGGSGRGVGDGLHGRCRAVRDLDGRAGLLADCRAADDYRHGQRVGLVGHLRFGGDAWGGCRFGPGQRGLGHPRQRVAEPCELRPRRRFRREPRRRRRAERERRERRGPGAGGPVDDRPGQRHPPCEHE